LEETFSWGSREWNVGGKVETRENLRIEGQEAYHKHLGGPTINNDKTTLNIEEIVGGI